VRLLWGGTAALLAVAAAVLAAVPVVLRAERPNVQSPVVRGTTTVLAIPLAGGAPREVLRLTGQYGSPTGASDGSLLLVRSTFAAASIWRFTAGRGARVSSLPASAQPVWSPDRSRYLTWEPDARIVIRRLDGTFVRTLTRQPGIGGISCDSWSGRFIGCVRTSRPTTGWRLDLEVWRDDGTLVRRRRLTSPFGSTGVSVRPDGRVLVLRPFVRSRIAPFPAPQWTPDGRALVYVDRRGRLLANGRVLLRRALGEFGLSADGRTVYVARVKVATSIPK
jgi:hypothetical protein